MSEQDNMADVANDNPEQPAAEAKASVKKGTITVFSVIVLSLIWYLLADRFITRSSNIQATLLVDGQPVALKPFAESFIRKTIQGMTSCLKGCGDAREITITIHPDQNDADR